MRFFKQLFIVLALLCATYAHAEVVEGTDYSRLSQPQPTASGNKIEVLEFFFYGCPHCYHLHGALNTWKKTMPKDVDLHYVPVFFKDFAVPMARTFYALESMGKLGKLHNDLYEAWNVFDINLRDEDKIIEFVAKHGVDRQRFKDEYESFKVMNKVDRTVHEKVLIDYGVEGTPDFVVDGKYNVPNRTTPEDTLRVLDEVIKLARKERNKKH